MPPEAPCAIGPLELVTNEHCESFRQDGFVVIRSLLTLDEVERGNNEVRSLLAREDLVFEFNWRTPIRKQDDGAWFVEKFDPICDISNFFASLAIDDRLVGAASRLIGLPACRLFKDKFIIKRPGQDGYPIHQDYNWWHQYHADEIVTFAVAFDVCDETSGAIEFFPGLHKAPMSRPGSFDELDDAARTLLADAESVVPELKPGDAVAFHPLTPHCSGRNLGCTSRRLYYPSYINAAAGDVFWAHYERHWAMLREGLSPALRERMCFI